MEDKTKFDDEKKHIILNNPLAIEFMTGDEYMTFCMVPHVREEVIGREKEYFKAHNIELTPHLKKEAYTIIENIRKGMKAETSFQICIQEYMKSRDFLSTKTQELSHRQTAIIERFKIDAGEMADYDLSSGWKGLTKGKKNREKAIRSMLTACNSKSYRRPTNEEINRILPYLEGFPKALKEAKGYLNKPN